MPAVEEPAPHAAVVDGEALPAGTVDEAKPLDGVMDAAQCRVETELVRGVDTRAEEVDHVPAAPLGVGLFGDRDVDTELAQPQRGGQARDTRPHHEYSHESSVLAQPSTLQGSRPPVRSRYQWAIASKSLKSAARMSRSSCSAIGTAVAAAQASVAS